MNENLKKVLIGAGLAAAGAVLAVVADAATGGVFGQYSPFIAAGVSVLLNIVRKAAAPKPTAE